MLIRTIPPATLTQQSLLLVRVQDGRHKAQEEARASAHGVGPVGQPHVVEGSRTPTRTTRRRGPARPAHSPQRAPLFPDWFSSRFRRRRLVVGARALSSGRPARSATVAHPARRPAAAPAARTDYGSLHMIRRASALACAARVPNRVHQDVPALGSAHTAGATFLVLPATRRKY